MAESRPGGASEGGQGRGGGTAPQAAKLGGLSTEPADSRQLTAGALAAGTFIGVLAAALLAGYELYDRLLRGEIAALVVLLVIFAIVGAYAGWLIGVVVFAATRSAGPGQEDEP